MPPDVRKGSAFPRLNFFLFGRLCLARGQVEAEPQEEGRRDRKVISFPQIKRHSRARFIVGLKGVRYRFYVTA